MAVLALYSQIKLQFLRYLYLKSKRAMAQWLVHMIWRVCRIVSVMYSIISWFWSSLPPLPSCFIYTVP